MKKIFTLVLMAGVASLAHAEFVSPGTGTNYTFADLAAIDTSGVTRADDGGYVVAQNLTISAGDILTLSNNDVVRLANGVTVNVDGTGNFAVSDTALITRTDDEANPKGFRFYSDNASLTMKHVRIEYAGISFGAANGSLTAEECTFTLHNGKLSSSGAISFNAVCAGNVVKNCSFIENTLAAIGGGATNPVGLTIENCLFYHNTTSNRNRPQINITGGGDNDIIIRNNTIIGGQYTLSGGIGVSNMMGMAFTAKVLIEGNDVQDNRYGIGIIGPMNSVIKNNNLVNNHYETNPNNGGSCISIYDSSGKGSVWIEGNNLEGGLWGITVIGSPAVNAGKIEDPTADDYNPGNNTFKDNGNEYGTYDFYNNGTSTIYAQGNTWNVEEQDSIHIEEVVFHQADSAALGLVIFMPAREPSGVTTIDADAAGTLTYSGNALVSTDGAITIYDLAGREITVAGTEATLETLPAGLYIARNARTALKFLKQ